MYDILIKGGTVIDGSGSPRFRADLAIHDHKIVAIGDLSDSGAVEVIDAVGKIVAPGFIDVNNHADVYWQLFYARGMDSLVTQGVTTIIGGNAGSSLAPLTCKKDIRSIQKWTDIERINLNWLSTEEFLQELQRKKLAVNFATLAGHGTMRRAVMHDQSRAITPEELSMLSSLLEDALKQGAIGMSTGLKYTHALSAAPREIALLAHLVKKHDGIYTTYVRSESENLVAAVDEAIAVGTETGVPVHISHLKAVYEENWQKMDEALEHISTAALQGVKISFDVYPYTSTSSVLYTLLPEWVTRKGRVMMMSQLKDARVRSAVVQDMKKSAHNYSDLLVAVSRVNSVAGHKKMKEIADMQGVSIEEAVVNVLLASEGRAIVSHEVLSPLNIEKALQSPHSIVSSNGAAYTLDHGKTGDFVHPRNFGTFPRVLGEYVRKKKILSLEEAIHKMTGKPAAVFKMTKRGLLKKNYAADVVVFDPETVIDVATLDDPYQFSVGVEAVLVNGEPVVRDSKLVGENYPGQILYKQKRGWFFS